MATSSALSPSVEYKKTGEGGGYINMDAGAPPHQLLTGFNKLLALTELLGVAVVVMVAVWCGQKGFAWTSEPALQFNLHPLLMTLGLIFLNANAILTFRVLRNNPKPTLKLVHGGLQCVILPLTVVGLVAVFDYHNANSMANAYSLHSWLGLGAVILFFAQWLFGFITFLFPGLSAGVRSTMLPIHVFCGIFIFILSVGASLTGLNEKAIFALGDDYSKLQSEAVLINCIGVFMVLFGAFACFLVTKEDYKRTPLPQDGSHLLASATRQ